MSRKPLHECPYCTCGQVELTWSDRGVSVFLDDHEGVADAVMSCALDSHFDRNRTGVPWGLPEKLREVFAPVVAKHLSAQDPDWDNVTIYMSEKDKQNFLEELIAVSKEYWAKVLK